MSFGKSFRSGLLAAVLVAASAGAGASDGRGSTGLATGTSGTANNPYGAYPKVLTFYLWNVDWTESGRTTTTRDGLGRVTHVFSEHVVGGNWQNSADIDLSYSTSDDPDTITTSIWQGVWVLSNRDIYSYDVDGRVTEKLYQVYYNGSWVDNGRTTYTYDIGGNLIEELRENYPGAWTNQALVEYSYTGGQLTQVVESNWTGVDWAEFRRETNTYAGGLLMETLTEYWSGSWQPEARSTYTYNGGLLDTETIEGYFGGAWQNSEQMIWESYDDQDRVLAMVSKLWNGSSYANLARYEYEYDLSTSVDEAGNAVLPNGTALAQNYPNPFNPGTVISFDLPVRSTVRLEVFDVLGRQVATVFSGTLSAGEHAIEWDGRTASGGTAASGVYFYRLSTDEGSLSRKMLLVK